MDNKNVQINSQPDNRKLPEKVKKFLLGPKIVFVILGVILLAEIAYAVRFVVSPDPVTPPPAPVDKAGIGQPPASAKISLSTTKAIFNVNEAVPVSVMVDTGGYTIDGVDLILRFDPKILEATAEGLIQGNILGEYPLKSADTSKGMVYISGVNSAKSGFTGIGQFAVINFKAKLPGKASFAIDFIKKGATTDSNLVEMGTSKDILEQVDNLELTVQ